MAFYAALQSACAARDTDHLRNNGTLQLQICNPTIILFLKLIIYSYNL